MAKQYVYSKLTASQKFTVWSENTDKKVLKSPKFSVLIQGGANLTNKNFVTPDGVLTVVDSEAIEAIKDIPTFKRHVAAGYIKVVSKKIDLEKAFDDMPAGDSSVPLKPKDLDKKRKSAA